MDCAVSRMAMIVCASLWTTLLVAQSQTSADGVLKRVGGLTERVDLLGVDEAGVMRFGRKAKLELAAEKVWRFGADRAGLRGAYVLLKDGSRLAAPLVVTEGTDLVFVADEFHPGLWDGLRIPLSAVRAILWKPPHGKAALMSCLALAQPVAADSLRLDNGDQVQGEFRGVVLNDGKQTQEVVFVVRGAESRIAMERVVSLRLGDAAKEAGGDWSDAWTLAFAEGSRVRAEKLVIGESGASWQSTQGVARKIGGELFWKNLICVEPPRREVMFLGDQAALSYRHLPTFGAPAEWKANRSALGEPLRHRGEYFEKGIGMWSNSRLSFAVPKNATRFEAEICIDDAAEEKGSAVFRVLAQTAGEKPELKELYRSEVLRGDGESKSISVDLAGAGSLILLVEAADQGEAGDLADWLDARFVGDRAAQ